MRLHVCTCIIRTSVFSITMLLSMMGGHGLGGAYGHIKSFEFSHSHIKENFTLKARWADIPYVCWGELCTCTYT